jgi:hypothetical protein
MMGIVIIFHQIILEISDRDVRWAGNVARRGTRDVHTKYCSENPKESDHLGDLGLYRRIIVTYLHRVQRRALVKTVMNFRVP